MAVEDKGAVVEAAPVVEEPKVDPKQRAALIESLKKVDDSPKSDKGLSFKEITVTAARRFVSLPKQLQGETLTKISAFGDPDGPGTYQCLSDAEIVDYGLRLMNVSPNAPNFSERVEEYFLNYTVHIPFDDPLKIKVPIDKATGEVVLNQNTKHHLVAIMQYRHVMKSPKVANDYAEYVGFPSKYWAFITDTAVIRKAKISEGSVKRDAMKAYLQLAEGKQSDERLWVLELLRRGIEVPDPNYPLGFTPITLQGIGTVDELEAEDQQLALEEALDKFPAQFLLVASDPDLETKALLEKMISTGVLRREGNIIMDDNDVIGSDDNEALARLKSPKFSQRLVALKAKIKNATA